MSRRQLPRVVVVPEGLSALDGALTDRELSVHATSDLEDVVEAGRHSDADCVLLGPAAGDGDAVDACARLRQSGYDGPVVLALRESLGERAEAAIAADISGTAPLAEPAAVGETVAELASEHAAERSEREQIERDAQMLETLLSNIPLSIYFKDRQHRHVRVSDAMICAEDPDLYLENDEGKAHQHPDDLLGKTDYDIFGPGAEPAIEDDRRVMDEEETVLDAIEETHTRLGEEAFFSTSKAPWYDENGEVVGVMGVTTDVTERIRYRRDLEAQNDRLEEFASMVSHDLRNPLSVLAGYLELLESGHDPAAIDHCQASVARMEELIDEILAFAREGRAVVDPDLVDLETVATEAWTQVDTGDAALTIDSELPVRADRARLTRVFENCFRNAIEHGVRDEPEALVGGATDADERDADERGESISVRIADDGTDFYVEDGGPGIPPESRESVFDRGVSSRADGTGFGLATVRAIAEAHGWDVSAEGGTEGGARIRFSGVARADQH